MAKKQAKNAFDLQQHYDKRLAKLRSKTPFVLRITEWKDKPIPVLVVKERLFQDESNNDKESRATRSSLIDRGFIAGEQMRRCLPIMRKVVEPVCDKAGMPLELQRYLTTEGLRMRGNFPLDEEAGAKLALIFRLQDRIKDTDRVELIAWRVVQFTREEAAYWLSRTISYGASANRWAISGLRVMLGGHSNDDSVQEMLEKFRIKA